MRLLTIITIILITWTKDFAQHNDELTHHRPLNNISFNLFGDVSLVSINYERQFLIGSTFILSTKFGVGLNPESPCCGVIPPIYVTIPHHITGNLGRGKHFFEFGLGGTIISDYKPKPYLLYPLIGYRLLPLDSGKINFRIFGLLPLWGPIGTDEFNILPIGLNVGISF